MKNIILSQKRFKPLIKRIRNTGGRSRGVITAPNRGNLCTRLYRFVDYKRTIFPGMSGLILRTEYNPEPRNHICLVCFPQGMFTNIIIPGKILVGDFVKNYTRSPSRPGDSCKIRYCYPGSIIHNIGLRPFTYGSLIRSSGCSAILVRKTNTRALVKLKSRELRYFDLAVTVTLGSIGDESNFLKKLGRAGTKRHRGKRPRVRPSAMNPVDHPMGGRTRGGSQPVNRKGIISTGRPTKRYDQSNILYTKRQMKYRRY